jgi:hypothetical protein
MAQRRQIRESRSLEGGGERPATGYGEPEAGAHHVNRCRACRFRILKMKAGRTPVVRPAPLLTRLSVGRMRPTRD